MKEESQWILALQKNRKKQSIPEANLLIQKYYDEIYVFCYKQIGHKETAMDLCQEIFIAVLTSISSYDKDKSSFRTWCYRIASHKVIDFRRRYRETLPLEGEYLELPDEFDFVGQTENRDLLKKIEVLVEKQKRDVQQIYRLRLYNQWSFVEIADSLQKSEATVKTKYHRLLKKIRKEFHHEYTHADPSGERNLL